MWRWDRLAALVVVGLLAPLAPVAADFPDGFNHPEVSWLELETDHFLLIYGEGLEPTARLSADLLEAAHERLTAELDVVPGAKTTVVLTDFDDVGFNNFARRMQHVIYISNPILNQARVEREQWLAHLLPHEYIHVLNGWALRRAGRAVGPLTEWAGMELQPQWFTEGLAEYFAGHGERREGQFILQAAQQNQLLYGGKLDIADLRFDVIETSVVYKQGESMCLYLAEKYGEDIFKRILGLYGKAPQFDIAFRVATGQLVEEFYRDWLQRIQARAAARPADDPVLASTTAYPTPLEAALGARVSPDGKLIAVYGVKDWEEPIPGLYLMNADGSHFHRIAGNLDLYDSWKFSWSADSRYLLYTGRIRGGSGAVLNGIFVYDTVKEKSWKVDSKAQRVGEPELSPDGKLILFTTYLNERTITATMTTDGANVRYLTADIPGNAFSPTWSPDGQSVAFSLADANGTDLAVIGRDGTGLRRLTNDPWPDQYPDWSPDGQTIAFVSFRQPGEERTDAAVSAEAQGLAVAATNLYTIPAAGGELTQLTEATSGGAYYPSWTPDGSGLAFSLFQIRNATVRRLEIAAARRAAAERPASAAEAVLATPAQPVRLAAAPAPVMPAATDAAPAATVPVATPLAATASEAPAAPVGRPSDRATVRPYRSLNRVQHYVTRPYQDNDGLGDAFGVRTRLADPLLQNQFTAQVQYGSGASDQIGAEFQYLNDQTAWTLGANIFRRVPPFRAERNALVAETSTGFELLAELPLATGNAYARDSLQFGYEWSEREPFATSGGVLRPAPQGARITGPSVGFQRTQLLPGIGEQEMRARVMRADNLVGSQLDFVNMNLFYVGRFFAPNPRRKAAVAAALDMFDGEDFTGTEIQQWVLSGEARYDWRLGEELASQHTWPYLHIGPTTFSLSYQLRELISGAGAGTDLRDRARVELVNRGYLTRHALYELAVGPTFYVGANGETDWLATLRFDWRDLPY